MKIILAFAGVLACYAQCTVAAPTLSEAACDAGVGVHNLGSNVCLVGKGEQSLGCTVEQTEKDVCHVVKHVTDLDCVKTDVIKIDPDVHVCLKKGVDVDVGVVDVKVDKIHPDVHLCLEKGVDVGVAGVGVKVDDVHGLPLLLGGGHGILGGHCLL